MKPITKQLVVAAFILALVTVLSLGIRQVRFSANRDEASETPIVAKTEPENDPADSEPVDAEPDPQHTDAAEAYEEEPSEDYSEAKATYAKAKGKKGLQKISMGDDANLYITEKGDGGK